MSKAVFLDRDGTIMADKGYLADPAGVELLPGAAEALRRLRRMGYLIVVISNQSGVARGLMTEGDVAAVNAALVEALGREGAGIDAIHYCPHHPSAGSPPYRMACGCRKPEPGMVLAAVDRLGIALEDSIVVGDKPEDLELGLRLGMPAYLVLTGNGKTTSTTPVAARATAIIPGLPELVQRLECHGEEGRGGRIP